MRMRLRGQVIVGIAAAACLFAPMQARAAPVDPLPPPGGTVPSPVGSMTYLTGPDHLAQITREDDLLHPRALSLARRVKIGTGVMMGGVALGALMIAGAASIFSQTECTDNPLGGRVCQSGHVNASLAAAGLLTGIVVGSVGVALGPSQTDWYDIINEWNSRHPDRSLLVAPGPHRH
jgi:hypothetical protein